MDELSSRPLDASALPGDLSACHALLVEQARAICEMQQSRTELSQEVEELKLALAKLYQQLYGRRSERVVDDPNQKKLDFGGDPQVQDALADAAAEAEQFVEGYVRRKKDPRRRCSEEFPPHIERQEVIVEATPDEKSCPTHGERQLIGYDETKTLEMVQRPKLRVRVTKYPKYACANHAECGVKQPARPKGLLEGNRYDTSIAAEIVAAKYGYHLPFYRQQDWFAGSGWTPSRSTLLNVSAAAAEVLRPLVEHFRQTLLAGGIGCDETMITLIVPPTIPEVTADDPRSRRIHEVLSQAQQEGRKSIKARMWAYRGWELPINVFDFTVSRHRDGPDEFLQDYTGKLMADCWSGFQKIELRSEARIVRGACWAHARRKVFDARGNHPQQASLLLAMIRELYDIEDRGKSLAADERRALRERLSRPVLDRIRAYLDSEATSRVLPKGLFGEALNYLRNHWEALNVFLADGRMPIDNNEVEQLMRQVAIGRKNWLFLGSVEAGNRAATLLTIVSTAVRNDLDVWAYVKDVLDQLLAGSIDYHSLRADVWKQSHPEFVRTYRADERRDAADRRHYHRAQRRLAAGPSAEGN